MYFQKLLEAVFSLVLLDNTPVSSEKKGEIRERDEVGYASLFPEAI